MLSSWFFSFLVYMIFSFVSSADSGEPVLGFLCSFLFSCVEKNCIWILGEAGLLESSFTVNMSGSKWALLKGDFPTLTSTPHSHHILFPDVSILFFLSFFCALDSWQSISHTLWLPSVCNLWKLARCYSRLSPRPFLCISDLNTKSVLEVPETS